MSEDSSSDGEWCVSTKRKCWECGKKFSSIPSLMSHYKSHKIKATCHICKVTFRRLTSLTTHLDNAHSPPHCKKCHQSFSNVWELNTHAETHCMDSVPFQEAPSLISAVIYRSTNSNNFSEQDMAQQSTKSKPQQRLEIKPEMFEHCVEYTVGEDNNEIDMASDCEKNDDSSSTESDHEGKTSAKPGDGDPESDDGSSSTDCSSDTDYNPHAKNKPGCPANSVCAACGKGPFKSVKLHMRHCSGVRIKYKCSLCKELFLSEKSLNEHLMSLYACEVCGQVFSGKNSYQSHQCPKASKSPLVHFCSESMPPACKICKLFFTCEKTLLSHVTKVHTSVVSTKVCIITKPSAEKKVSPVVHGTAAQSTISGANVVSQVTNGKLCAGQSYAVSTSSLLTSSNAGKQPVPLYLVPAASATRVRSANGGTQGQPSNQPSTGLSAPDTAASEPVSTPVPSIMAIFENDSHGVALMKRMNTGWRSKAPYPCRQCGAILRQPSFIISHRYLHRGRRSHQCQCGRAFKHRLHLLRHCVQHAETISYICVGCGETFIGAKLLAKHIKGKSLKKSHSGRKRKHKDERKCRNPFTCDCGQLFFRPSAYIWHQLRNRKNTKQLKKPLK